MRSAVLLALLAGAFIAIQSVFNVVGQRTLGLAALISISGFATGIAGLVFALMAEKPVFTARGVGLAIGSGLLGCMILACVTFSVGQTGVARALSLVIASQLFAGLVLDSLGVLGNVSDVGLLKVVGVLLIVVGGILVVRF